MTQLSKAAVWQRMQEIASQDKVSDEEVREYNALEVRLKGFDLAPLDEGILDGFDTGTRTAKDATVLRSDQSMTDWVAKNVSEERTDLSFAQLIRGATTGNWDGVSAEARAMAGSAGSTGGFTVPAGMSASVIDLARSKSAVVGKFSTVPMTSDTQKLPKLASEPTPSWRGEGDAFTEGDFTFGATELQAKNLGVFAKASIEVLDDSSVSLEALVMDSFAKAIATAWDQAAMYGDGDGGSPVGLINTAGVNDTDLGGAPADYDFLIDLAGVVTDNNYAPGNFVTAPRVERQLQKLVTGIASDLTKLVPPSGLNAVETSTAVSTTSGAGSNESQVFTGEWAQAYWGQRTNLRFVVLNERYLVDEGAIGFLVYSRGDIAFPRPGAFAIKSGIDA